MEVVSTSGITELISRLSKEFDRHYRELLDGTNRQYIFLNEVIDDDYALL